MAKSKADVDWMSRRDGAQHSLVLLGIKLRPCKGLLDDFFEMALAWS